MSTAEHDDMLDADGFDAHASEEATQVTVITRKDRKSRATFFTVICPAVKPLSGKADACD